MVESNAVDLQAPSPEPGDEGTGLDLDGLEGNDGDFDLDDLESDDEPLDLDALEKKDSEQSPDLDALEAQDQNPPDLDALEAEESKDENK
jgi:hypothetical protein